jgi:protein arginine phosphatase
MPDVISWQQADPSTVLDRALSALAEGALVAVPTESGYEVLCSAERPPAVMRLAELAEVAGNGAVCGMTIALSSAGQLLDWVPRISRLGLRFARRGWPGPLILLTPDERDASTVSRLPDETRRLIGELLAFRVPDHDVPYVLARYSESPLVSARAAASAPQQLAERLGEHLTVIIDDGECANRELTVVQIDDDAWHVLHEGAVTLKDLHGMTSCRILFVCTGNTCRSPLAEALCMKLLAERLGCPSEALAERGYVVGSAGLAAYPGNPAAAEAVDVGRELGVDLSRHQSRPLTAALLLQADHLIAMTRSHLDALTIYNVPGAAMPRLLSAEAADIPDPIGCSADVYRDCARQILHHLEALLPQLQS